MIADLYVTGTGWTVRREGDVMVMAHRGTVVGWLHTATEGGWRWKLAAKTRVRKSYRAWPSWRQAAVRLAETKFGIHVAGTSALRLQANDFVPARLA